MPHETSSPRYRREPRLSWRRVLDETIVLDLERRVIYAFGPDAADVLQRLDEPRTTGELAELLPGDAAAPDRLPGYLEELVEHGLATRLGAGAPELAEERPPWLVWSEPLPEVVHQASPPMEITNTQCFQQIVGGDGGAGRAE